MELALNEELQLRTCEEIIEKGMASFVTVGNALMTIRDKRLYLKTHDTFESYCKDRWGFKRSYAYELIGAAEVKGNLSGIPDTPTSVSQYRPLTVLPAQQQSAAWTKAVETAPDGKVTAKHVENVVRMMTAPDIPQTFVDPPTENDVLMAHHYATIAINQLEKINRKDPSRKSEGVRVIKWCIKHLSGGKYHE